VPAVIVAEFTAPAVAARPPACLPARPVVPALPVRRRTGAIRHRRLHQVRERLGHAMASFLLLFRLGNFDGGEINDGPRCKR
jgi:hypothetical protein